MDEPGSLMRSDFLMSVKTFSALAAAEWKAVFALDTNDASISYAEFVAADWERNWMNLWSKTNSINGWTRL